MKDGRIATREFRQLFRNIQMVDALVICRRLLTDKPFKLGPIQVFATLSDRRLQPFGRVTSVRAERHIILTDMIINAGQLDLVTFRLQLLQGLLDEGDEGGVEISILCARALRSPVVDLGTAVSELRDRDVADRLALQRMAETQFRAERVVEACRAERFPALRRLKATADAVLEGDLVIVAGEYFVPAQRLEFLRKSSFALHVAMPGKDEELDQASFFIRPSFQRSVGRELLSNRTEVGIGVVHAMLKLTQGPVVVVQPNSATDLHRVMRSGDVFRQRIRLGDGLLTGSDRIHILTIVHAPDRLGAQLANVKLQIRHF